MNIRKFTVQLHTADFLVIALGLILSLINLIFAARIPQWWQLILVNCVASFLVCCLGYARHATGSKLLRFVHDWYVAPVAFFSFKELYFMIKPSVAAASGQLKKRVATWKPRR